MRADRLDFIRSQERVHFWFAARKRIVADACAQLPIGADPVVVDVGCGTGSLLAELYDQPSSLGIDLLASHSTGQPLQIPLVAGSADDLPVRSEQVDLALALDVIEHVDDVRAARELHRILRPGGFVVATVPALQKLWSYRDVDAGHLRRYSKPQLVQTFLGADFSIERCSYFQGALLPILALSRTLPNRTAALRDLEDSPPGLVNSALGLITRAESALAVRGVRAPLGSSLVIVARREP